MKIKKDPEGVKAVELVVADIINNTVPEIITWIDDLCRLADIPHGKLLAVIEKVLREDFEPIEERLK